MIIRWKRDSVIYDDYQMKERFSNLWWLSDERELLAWPWRQDEVAEELWTSAWDPGRRFSWMISIFTNLRSRLNLFSKCFIFAVTLWRSPHCYCYNHHHHHHLQQDGNFDCQRNVVWPVCYFYTIILWIIPICHHLITFHFAAQCGVARRDGDGTEAILPRVSQGK